MRCCTRNLDMEKRNLHKSCPVSFRVWLPVGLVLLTVLSTIVAYIFWCTDTFNDSIVSGLELKNGTQSFAWWEDPPVNTVYKIRVFNYTNVDDFKNGIAEKLHVKEVGPYVYRETLNRVNVEVNEDGTVTYQEKRSYEWDGRSPDDELVIVPNIPLMTATARYRDSIFGERLFVSGLLYSFRSKPFIEERAGGFIWGYDDKLFDLVKQWDWTTEYPFEKFGMLALKSGVSKNRITIHTGAGNLSNLGMYQRFNGEKSRAVWDDEECDKIDGTDGSMFPPNLIKDRNAILDIYSPEMCRTLPMKYAGYGSAHEIPSLRYKHPKDMFTSDQTKNACFCPKTSTYGVTETSCPPAGIFNVSACSMDAPLLISFPHFLNGDKSLLQYVDGLDPREELHESYFDVHPRLGVPIGGYSRIQMNVEVRTASTMPYLGPLKDGAILPLLWIEVGVDELPDEVLNILRDAYFLARAVEATFQWGSLSMMIFSFTSLLILLIKKSDTPRFRSGISSRVNHPKPICCDSSSSREVGAEAASKHPQGGLEV